MADVFQPHALLFLLVGVALVHLWRRRCASRGRLLLVILPFSALTVLNLPLVGYLTLGTLEWPYPPPGADPEDGEAIVVLSGSLLPPDPVRRRADLAPDTLYRCLHAAALYHRGPPRPVLVSGGKVDPNAPGPTLAQAMRDFLRELGVRDADLILEDRSRTTFENAFECRRVLQQRGIRRVVLVTDAMHLPRALRCFHAQGIEALPSGCHYRATRFDPSLPAFLPSPSAALHCQQAFHEWLGIAWYWLSGKT